MALWAVLNLFLMAFLGASNTFQQGSIILNLKLTSEACKLIGKIVLNRGGAGRLHWIHPIQRCGLWRQSWEVRSLKDLVQEILWHRELPLSQLHRSFLIEVFKKHVFLFFQYLILLVIFSNCSPGILSPNLEFFDN